MKRSQASQAASRRSRGDAGDRHPPARQNHDAGAGEPTIVADVVLTFGFICWAMAIIVALSSVSDASFGDAGRLIAFMFAGSLIIAGGFLWLLAVTLLRDARWSAEAYYAPFFVGVVVAAIEVVLLFNLWVLWLWAPVLLVVFALRPVRRSLLSPLYQGGARR